MSLFKAPNQLINHDDASPRVGRRGWFALAILALPVVMVAADSTILGFAVPALSQQLEPGASQLLWIVDVYSFVLAGLLVTMGTLGDKIGRKKLLLVGASAFGLASLLAAFSTSATMLIVARVLLGVAGATLMPSTLSMIRDIFRNSRQRALAISIWSAAAASGAALGPIAGGFLVEHFWWGSVFLVNVPVIVVLVVVGSVFLPESRNPHAGRFDILSSVFSLAGILPLVYAIKHVAEHGLDVWAVLSTVVGILFLVIFIRRQRRLSSPMLDLTLFKNKAFTTGILVQAGSIFALAGSLFVITQYLQLVLGMRPLQSAMWLVPAMVAEATMALLSAKVASWMGTRSAITLGMATLALGFAIAVVAGVELPVIVLGVGMFVLGVGSGLSYALSADAIMGAVTPERAGSAAAVAETAYELGHAMGVAILGSILAVVYRATLVLPSGLSQEQVEQADSTLGGALDVASQLQGSAGEAFAAAARTSFVYGLLSLGMVAVVFVGTIAVLAWKTLPRESVASARH